MTRDAFLTEKGVESRIQTTIWFGKYRILELIGSGSFSKVYLAEHLKLKALRAIKQIKKDGKDVSSILLEANLLKNLKHPGIPVIYDMEEDDRNLYIIEEYIQGESLEAFRLHQTKISEKKIAEIGIQLCDILTYLHGQKPYPLLYLDMKPQHVFLEGDLVRLVDFGISSYLNEKNENCSHYGTKGYAAPELFQNFMPGIQTDIYGVGCVLDFLAKNGPNIRSKVLHTIIERAMQNSSTDRYEQAKDMREDLSLITNERIPDKKIWKERHLLKKVAVCGSMERIGVTHFSIALNCFFNEQNRKCIYREHSANKILWKLARANSKVVEKEGRISYQYFCGATNYLKDNQIEDSKVQVIDLGSVKIDHMEFSEYDSVILLVGARDWEKEETYRIYEQMHYCRNLVIVCNYGNQKKAREYAHKMGRRIYCFPLDPDPFQMTAEKIQFFTKMAAKEGW